MEINKNNTLINEREEILSEAKSQPLLQNIIVIYIDALSRVHTHRKLPKTLKWFEKNCTIVLKQYQFVQENQRKSFEFFRYHSSAHYTDPNAQLFLFGHQLTKEEIAAEYDPAIPPKYNCIFEDFKKAGFITGHSSDFCSVLPIETEENFIANYNVGTCDHENFVQACDLNYEIWPYSAVPRCLYGKNVFEYSLEYGEKFLEAYSNETKMMYMEFIDAHEWTGEVVGKMDDKLSEFLEEIEEKQLTQNAAVILFADHGLHMHGPLRAFNLSGDENEVFLPSMFISLPLSFNNSYPDLFENITNNQQKLVNGLTIYNFFQSLMHGTSNKSYIENGLFGNLPVHADCQDSFLHKENNYFCACSYQK